MKILLTSDWHLGKYLYKEKLLNKQAEFFQKEFFPLLKDLKPDLLIVAGDILDRPIPDQDTLYFYADLLKELSSYDIPSFFILGNHDSKRTALHRYFLEKAKIYLIDHLEYFFSPFLVKDQRGNTLNLYFLPYLPLYELFEKAKEDPLFAVPERISYVTVVKNLLERRQIKSPSLFISHFALEQFHFCGEEVTIKGFSEEYILPVTLLYHFDLIFLGHLHRPQKAKEKFFYPGAPLPYSFEASTEKRGVLFFEWKENSLVKSEFLELTPPYELLYLKGSFEEIMEYPKSESYTKILLYDEKPIFNVYERIKTKFPNLLSLEYVTAFSSLCKNLEEIDFTTESIKVDERELFRDFYQFVEKKEIEPKLWEVFLKNLDEFYQLERKEGRIWP
ncbi:MAG: exonuclease SbcCD subunit D [Caldimicrobium sp.]